jgi:glycosyltransferase involved in cell wall biosynthesis
VKKRTLEVARAWLALDGSLKCRSRLLLIGEGELRPELEELARSPEANRRITLIGFVNQQELPDFYLACDATVLASETEPHGQVVTESLFLGVPAIVSDQVGCVGPEDVMRDGETGLVYSCGDTKGLSAAMKALMSDRVRYGKYAQRAREVASGQDARAVAGQFIDAFERVLRSPRPTLLDRIRTFVPSVERRD